MVFSIILGLGGKINSPYCRNLWMELYILHQLGGSAYMISAPYYFKMTSWIDRQCRWYGFTRVTRIQ